MVGESANQSVGRSVGRAGRREDGGGEREGSGMALVNLVITIIVIVRI